MDRMADAPTLLDESRSLCTDHQCPNCGLVNHVTAERVLVGDISVTLCHCRMCEHSWHPGIESEPV
jgi:transcription elongation factor Elf1